MADNKPRQKPRKPKTSKGKNRGARRMPHLTNVELVLMGKGLYRSSKRAGR